MNTQVRSCVKAGHNTGVHLPVICISTSVKHPEMCFGLVCSLLSILLFHTAAEKIPIFQLCPLCVGVGVGVGVCVWM